MTRSLERKGIGCVIGAIGLLLFVVAWQAWEWLT